MNALETDLEVGAGTATLEIGTTGMSTVLAVIQLATTPGSVTGDVWTAGSLPRTIAASNSGTAAEGRIKNKNGDAVVTGLTVGTSGTNVIVSPSTTITSGQTVNLTACTITHNTSGV